MYFIKAKIRISTLKELTLLNTIKFFYLKSLNLSQLLYLTEVC